jgi:hypothetical protein
MRDAVKNKQTLYQKRYLGKTEILDGDGFGTGSFIDSFGSLLELRKNIIERARDKNVVTNELFGTIEKHAKLIVTAEPFDVGILDLFWIDVSPTESADYKVTGIYKSLNTTIVGLDKRVTNV